MHSHGPKPPARITREYLLRATTHYLERWFSPRAHLRRLMLRRVRRSAEFHGDALEPLVAVLDDVLDTLERGGLLNDAAYARSKARSLTLRGTPARAIRNKLQEKGVPSALIDEVLREQNATTSDPDLYAALRYARRRRLGPWSTQRAPASTTQRDLGRFARAGFSYHVAQRVLQLTERDESEELLASLESSIH